MKLFTALVVCTVVCFQTVAGVPPEVFRTRAEGFGARSKGGKGGRILRVTSLDDSGPGTLREALTASGPRIIRFDIGGTIRRVHGGNEFNSDPPECPSTKPCRRHHLEDLRTLMGEPVDLGRRQEADVIVVAEVAHHRIHEVSRRDGTPSAELGRDGNVQPRRWAEQVPAPPRLSQRRCHMVLRDSQ